MSGIGWFKVHRELMDKAIWKCSTPEQKVILITLLKMVNFIENEWLWEGDKYKVEPGQMITSLESIMKESGKGISIQKIRTSLKKFEKYEFLTNESTKTGRLITIVNWGLYQSTDDELTKQLTVNQQSTNKELTTIKESKNEKNINTSFSEENININKEDLGLIEHRKESKERNAHNDLFEKLWKEYPNKKGKNSIKSAAKKKILLLGEEKMIQAINAYKKDLETNTWKQPMNGSTFFSGRYEDYFDNQEETNKAITKKMELKPFDPSKWE